MVAQVTNCETIQSDSYLPIPFDSPTIPEELCYSYGRRAVDRAPSCWACL